jgi:hypothetical protein
MSTFRTHIPIDIEAVMKLLPEGSLITGISPTKEGVELKWQNSRLVSPFTFELTFSLEQLRAKELPEKVTERGPVTPPVHKEPPAKNPMTIAVKAGKRVSTAATKVKKTLAHSHKRGDKRNLK